MPSTRARLPRSLPPGGVAEQLDPGAVPVEPHVCVQALMPLGRSMPPCRVGLRRVNAVEPVSVWQPLRDELAEVEQHRAGGRVAGVGVGLDDDRESWAHSL